MNGEVAARPAGTRHVVATVAEVPPGERKLVMVAGREIGIFNVGGRFFAVRNRCPHQGGPLCQGRQLGLTTWIEDVAQIGRLPDGAGLWRRPYTEDDERALDWVRTRAEARGLSWRRDTAGNVIARFPGTDPTARAIATGSHLDTVRSGGKY